MSTTRVRLLLLIVPALWGMVFVGVAEVLKVMRPVDLTTVRFTMIGVAFGLLMLFVPAYRPRLDRRQWRLVWLAALFGVPLTQFGIIFAQQYLHPTLASLVVTTSPAAAAIISPIFLKERLSRRQALGFVIAFLGAGVVIIGGAGGASFSSRDILGAAVGIITPISWACYTVVLKKLSGTGEPLATVGIGMTVGLVFLVPLMPRAFAAAGSIDGRTWAWLLFLAFLGSFLPYVIWFRALKVLTASQTAAYMYLVPLFALIFSLLILGLAPPVVGLFGGVLILAGVILTQLRRRPVVEVPA